MLPMRECNRDHVHKAVAIPIRGPRGWADGSRMAGAERTGKPVKGRTQNKARRGPEWASGLKQLYDSVIDEPIPDAFKDLLSKLDDGKR